MPHSIDAIVYVEEPPIIEIKGGMVHIQQISGNWRVERVMLPSVFRKSIRLAQRALAEFEAHGSAEVIPFALSKTEDPAASHS